MKPGTRVILVSFDGKRSGSADTPPTEDYWKLVGTPGTLVEVPEEREFFEVTGPGARVCIEFDSDVRALGLEAHNSVKNNLWVLLTDLHPIE